MADVERGNRPLSPHISIYRWPLNMAMSILHRMTGVALGFSAVLIVWWFLAASTSEAYFAVANGVLTSWLGKLVLLGSLIAIWFHFVNGIRHLVWDTGSSFGQKRVLRTGQIALVVTLILVIVTLYVA